MGWVFLIAALVGCSSDDVVVNDAVNDADSPFGDCGPVATPSLEEARALLIGTWSYTRESMCTETYRFSGSDEDTPPAADGSYVRNEAQEEWTGLYGLELAEDGSEMRLRYRVLTDNEMPDCAGVTEDESGARFVGILSFPSDVQMRLVDPVDPSICPTFVRN